MRWSSHKLEKMDSIKQITYYHKQFVPLWVWENYIALKKLVKIDSSFSEYREGINSVSAVNPYKEGKYLWF